MAAVRDLHPAQFALVMATGIVSQAAFFAGFPTLAGLLLVLNVVFYGALWLATIVRLVWHPHEMLRDLRDHGRGVGFFTTVAATDVLGAQFLVIHPAPGIATGLWVLGTLLCCLLGYSLFAAFTLKSEKPTLERAIHGGWLLPVVAVQSVSVLGSLLVSHHPVMGAELGFFALVMWLIGGMLYLWIISLIFHRYLFHPLEPSDLAPPYWINMGAMAISTLAGVNLVAVSGSSPPVHDIVTFIKGFSLFFWATATWWIPMLLILGVWRHGYRHHPLTYDPLYWGLVFPLGMYAVATHRLVTVLALPSLGGAIHVLFPVALIAWVVVFIGLLRSCGRWLGTAVGRPDGSPGREG